MASEVPAGTAMWLARGEHDLPSGGAWLTADEATRASGMSFTKRRTRVPPAALGLQSGRRRRRPACRRIPRLWPASRSPTGPAVRRLWPVDGVPTALDVSLSDRAGWAVCLVGSGLGRVGCDLEIVEPRSAGFRGRLPDRCRAGVRRRSARRRPRRRGQPDLVGEGERAEGAADRPAPGHPQRRGRARRSRGHDRVGPARAYARPRAACSPVGGGVQAPSWSRSLPRRRSHRPRRSWIRATSRPRSPCTAGWTARGRE